MTRSLGGHRRPRQKRLGCFLMGTTAGLGVSRTGFSHMSCHAPHRVRRLLDAVPSPIGPFRKPSSLSWGVGAARSRSGEDPVLSPDLTQSRSHRILSPGHQAAQPPLARAPLITLQCWGCAGGVGFHGPYLTRLICFIFWFDVPNTHCETNGIRSVAFGTRSDFVIQ